jgi:hypothetical protein
MGEMDKLESDTSSNDSHHVSDTKTFPLATVDEPVLFDTAGKTRESAFDTESFESYYKPIESYEGYHRWDPKFQWEAKEEKKLVRKVSSSSTQLNWSFANMFKIDLRICSWVWLAFLDHVQTDILLMFFELKLYVFCSAIG